MTVWSLRGGEGQFVFLNAEKSIRNVLVFVYLFLSRRIRLNVGRALRCYTKTVAYRRGGGLGCSNPPSPRNSEDIGGVLEQMSKKNRRLDFLL